jgi:hypothetical protein
MSLDLQVITNFHKYQTDPIKIKIKPKGFPHIFYDLDQRVIVHNRVFKKDLAETLYDMINSSYIDYEAEIKQHRIMLEEKETLLDKQNNLIEGGVN